VDRLKAIRPKFVDQPRHRPLPRARLAENEHRRRRSAGKSDLIEEAVVSVPPTDELVESITLTETTPERKQFSTKAWVMVGGFQG
jgi:hypothetical protein